MKAEYINHMGSDLTVVNAARVSFDKESEFERSPSGEAFPAPLFKETLSAADTKLIAYLAKHNHWTPFSHPQITLRETVPIFVARQRFKHMVGFTYNEVSRRYVDGAPEFFVPEVWRSRPEGSVKQGSGTDTVTHLEYLLSPITGQTVELPIGEAYEHLIRTCETTYNLMLTAGVAPEQARMVLPQSMMTSYYVTGSLAAFARAYKQRIDPHAQVEIQELAKQWGEIIAPLFPTAWKALTQTENA